jgi:hypothetical protein
VYRGFGSLRASIALRVTLLSDAGRRALGLLDGRLLDERLRLAVQVSRFWCRRGGHGPKQRRGSDELLARSWRRLRVVDVNAVAGLYAQLTCAFATRGGFSCHGGAEQPHRPVFFCQLGLELARLS